MAQENQVARLGRAERIVLRLARRIWPVTGLVLLAIGGLAIFGYNVSMRLDNARAAQSDNAAWLIAQAEVDTLKLELAVREAMISGDVQKVRRAYDIQVSRVNIVDSYFASSVVLQPLAGSPDWDHVQTTTTALGPLIDRPNADVLDNLPEILVGANAMRESVRKFAVDALGLQIEAGLRERETLAWLLVRAAALGFAVILFLLTAVWVMAYLATRLRERHKEVDRARGNLERTLAATRDGVLVVGADGRIREANKAAEAIFDWQAVQMLGVRVQELLSSPNGPESIGTMLRRTRLGNAGDHRAEVTAWRADGREVPVEMVMTRGEDADGLSAVFVFLRDISERHEYEQTLRAARDSALHAAEAKTRFLAVMSHEMRTPMNGVIAALDILMRTTRLTRKQARFTEIAERSAQLALEQINDVLEMAHLEEGGAEEAHTVFNVTLLLQDLAEQMQPLAGRNGNRLHVDAPAQDLAWVSGPRRRLLRVLINLAGNATKFTQGGRIELRAAFLPDPASTATVAALPAPTDAGAPEPGEQPPASRRRVLQVEVLDTGIGIAPDRIEAIFEPFETLDDSYDRRAGGTGLGLGIARRTLERIGGRLGVESEPGRGSRFWFHLPLETAPPPLPAPAGSDAEETPLAVMDVLIAEDNATNRMVLGEMLRHLGQRVIEARDGAEAIASARAQAFDLILMDVSMPLVDGLAATREIRAAGASRRARIVALTAHGFPEELARFRAGGLTEILQKPITLAGLRPLLSGGSPADAALDCEVIADLRALLPIEKRRKLLADLLDEADAFASALAEGGDAAELARRAHRLQGAASILGARELVQALRAIETSMGQGPSAETAALNRRFTEVFARMRVDLPAALAPDA